MRLRVSRFLMWVPLVCAFICGLMGGAFAANDLSGLDASLGEMSNSMSDIIRGYGGKIIALLALVWAIMGSIFKFNVMLVLTLFGVLLMLAFGVSMIDSVF